MDLNTRPSAALMGDLYSYLFGAAWYNVKDHGLVGDGVTDDTAALQTLINTIAAAGENAVVYFPDEGPYLFNGAYQDTSRSNCVIKLPENDIENKYYSITFKGFAKPVFSPSAFSSQPLPSATILKTTKSTGSGTLPSLFGGYGPVGGDNFECSYVEVGFEDLIVQVPNNPQLTPINLKKYTQTILRNVAVITGAGFSVMDTTEPTNSGVYGIIQPDYSAGCYQKLEGTVMVVGFYNGLRVGENCLGDDVEIYSCNTGTVHDFSHGVAHMKRISFGWCKTHMKFNAEHTIKYDLVNIERWVPGSGGVTTKWYDYVTDIADSTDEGRGELVYQWALAGVGRQSGALNKTGGTDIVTRQLGTAY